LAEGRWSSHQQGINAPRAVWTWHSVTSGFFFPQVLSHSRQEQETDRADHQMTFQSQVSSALVVIQAHLSFLVLEATLDVPPREAHQQHRSDRGLRSRVADEELDLLGIQDIPSDQQVQRFAREAVLILGEEPGVLDLPNHRPFLPILDPPTSPGLVPEFAPVEHLVDTSSVGTVGSQPRNLTPAPTSLAMERSCDHAGSLEPTGEIAGDLVDELLVARGQAAQETGLASVHLVEGQPLEVDAAAPGAVQQFQGDLPLGPVGDRLRDAGLAAPLSVRRPVLRRGRSPV